MKQRTFHISRSGDQYWAYLQRSAGHLPDEPLHVVLTWILEQINFGNIDYYADESGDITTLRIGKEAAWSFGSEEEAEEHAKGMLLAVALNQINADAREAGVDPDFADSLKFVNEHMTDGVLRNTEMHFAQQLVKLLKRMSDKTFKFAAPPIAGIAPDEVISYMREAAKCWMFGLYNACAGLCRACLEASLRDRLGARQIDTWRKDLVWLIEESLDLGILDRPTALQAQIVRSYGNDAIHGKQLPPPRCREILDAMRGVVEHVYSTNG